MTQRTQIKKHFKSGKTLTARQAQTLFGCDRLAARVGELRREMDIHTEMIKVRGREGPAWVAKYGQV